MAEILLLPVLCIIEELSSVIEFWFKVTKHVGFWLYNTTRLPWYRGLHITERVTNDSKIPTSLFEKPRQRLPTILVKRADQWKSIPQSDFLFKDRGQKEVFWKHPFCLLFHVLAVSISGSFLGPQVHYQDPEQLGPLAEGQAAWPGGICRLPLSWSLQHSLTVTYGPGAHERTTACRGVRQFWVVRGADPPSTRPLLHWPSSVMATRHPLVSVLGRYNHRGTSLHNLYSCALG